MTEQLTGYEASSVAEIEAILDASPADADTVYLDTIAYSERAIAAVAAKRAGGGGSQTFAEILAASGDTGGHPITNGAGSSLTLDDSTVTLETDLDVEVHATVQDINVTADGGNINVRTDPDFGGGLTADVGGVLNLVARSVAARLQGAGGNAHAVVSSIDSYAQIESAAASVRLLANGSMWLHLSNTPIADGDLPGPGFFGFWLDATDGAAKFCVKGKTADGTVVQGELALS